MENMDNILFAFLLTLFAGLSTGIGSAIAFFTKTTNRKFLSVALGFSAGVMIYVSLVVIFAKAKESLIAGYGSESQGYWMTIVAFFTGMLFIALIDKFVPSEENPHEIHFIEEMSNPDAEKKAKLMRMGTFVAIAITIHNFPEGFATFIAGLQEPELAWPIAVAIAIHNIPEGISVSVPIYYATGSRKKAFRVSFLSGVSEPIGAAVGYLILLPFMNDLVLGFTFAAVAGIMVFISLDELLPAAREYGEHHLSIYGLIAGMVVMAVSLVLFV